MHGDASGAAATTPARGERAIRSTASRADTTSLAKRSERRLEERYRAQSRRRVTVAKKRRNNMRRRHSHPSISTHLLLLPPFLLRWILPSPLRASSSYFPPAIRSSMPLLSLPLLSSIPFVLLMPPHPPLLFFLLSPSNCLTLISLPAAGLT